MCMPSWRECTNVYAKLERVTVPRSHWFTRTPGGGENQMSAASGNFEPEFVIPRVTLPYFVTSLRARTCSRLSHIPFSAEASNASREKLPSASQLEISRSTPSRVSRRPTRSLHAYPRIPSSGQHRASLRQGGNLVVPGKMNTRQWRTMLAKRTKINAIMFKPDVSKWQHLSQSRE